MGAALPQTLPDHTEFDLDVRLQAVARHVPTDLAAERTQAGCPDYPVTEVSCETCRPPC